MTKLNPQFALSFNGTCEAAFRCYERCLNGTLTFVRNVRRSGFADGWDEASGCG